MHEHRDREAAENVYHRDDDAGDRITTHELRGTVHRSVEVGFTSDFLASGAGIALRDQTCREIRIDRHLLAGHRVEGEACGHFRHSRRTLGDHHELHDDQDDEDDRSDDRITPGHEVGESLDHFTCGTSRIRVVQFAGGENQPSRRDVEDESEESGRKEQRREDAEVQRPLHVDGGQENNRRDGDVSADQNVEGERRKRHHKHPDQPEESDRNDQMPIAGDAVEDAGKGHLLGHVAVSLRELIGPPIRPLYRSFDTRMRGLPRSRSRHPGG